MYMVIFFYILSLLFLPQECLPQEHEASCMYVYMYVCEASCMHTCVPSVPTVGTLEQT